MLGLTDFPSELNGGGVEPVASSTEEPSLDSSEERKSEKRKYAMKTTPEIATSSIVPFVFIGFY